MAARDRGALACLALGLALGTLGLVLLLLDRMALGGPLLDLVLGLRQCGQRRAISAGASSPSLTGRLSLSSASLSSNCTSSRSCASIRLACSHDSALCLLALAAILVPSSAMVPSFRHFISRASISTCTNSASICGRKRRRNGSCRGHCVGAMNRHRVVAGALDLRSGPWRSRRPASPAASPGGSLPRPYCVRSGPTDR